MAAVTSNDVFSTTQQHTESNGTKDILAGRLQQWLDRCSEHDHVDQISMGDFANPLSLSLCCRQYEFTDSSDPCTSDHPRVTCTSGETLSIN